MSGTLDKFFPPTVAKSKPDTGVFVEERCDNPKCRKVLKITDMKYTLIVKGKKGNYCPTCAKQILQPHENTEENL